MLKVWMSHGDKVTRLPDGFMLMASTPSCPIAGWPTKREATTACSSIPKSRTRCRASSCSTVRARYRAARGRLDDGIFIDEAVARIREQVGHEEVLLGLSGGVDSASRRRCFTARSASSSPASSWTTACCARARREQVMDMFAGKLQARGGPRRCERQFLGHLDGVTDPEQKRKIIGREFIEVFQARGEEAARTCASWRRARSIPT